MRRWLALLLLLVGSFAPAQTSKTGRIMVGTLALRPTTCSPGDQYTASDQTPPQEFICGPANTWNLQTGGGGGGGSIGPGTAGNLVVFTTSTTGGNSTCTDLSPAPTACPDGVSSEQQGFYARWTVDTGGVQASKTVCRGTTSHTVVICPAGTTQGMVGVANTTVSAGGTVLVCFAGKCNVIAATNTTEGDWLIPSLTVAGEVDDTGSPSKPTTGTQTLPSEATITAGSLVLTTWLSPDTLNASATAGSNVNPASQFALPYYSASGTGNNISGVSAPTLNGGKFLCGYLPTGSAVAPGCPQVGVLPRALAASDAIVCGDDAGTVEWSGAGTSTVTVPDIGSSCFANGHFFKAINGNGTLTLNRTSTSSFIVANGSNSSILTSLTLGAGNSAIFTKDADGTDWSVTVSGAPSTSGSFSPSPNVNAISGTTYTVNNADNTWDDKFTAGSAVSVTLPQANSVTNAPFVASRYAVRTTCTSCPTTPYSQVAGDTIYVGLGFQGSSPPSFVSVSDTAGSNFQRVRPDLIGFKAGGNSGMALFRALNVPVSASNTLTVGLSGSATLNTVVLEYTPVVIDKADSTSTNGNAIITDTIGVSNLNEVALSLIETSGGACPTSWVQRGSMGDSFQFCERLLSATPSVTQQVADTNGSAIILSDYGFAGTVSFAAGWEFYAENATSPCSAVTVTPTTSTIKTATLTGLTSFIVPCGMTARFRSDGTNYEMFQLTGTNGQQLSSTYTNATTGFTSTTLTFPLQAGESKSGSCHLTYQGTATTAAPILQFTGPASPVTVTANLTETLTSGSSPTFYSASTTGSTFALGLGATAIVSTATDMPMQLDFGIINGTTAGVVTLQVKSNGAGTVTLEKGSSCTVY